jgi:uncharacterized delta-60 repeat protein
LLVLATVTLLVVPSAGAAAPGDVDLSFGVGGLVTTDIGSIDALRAIAVQPDGKIIATGTASTTSWGVARYLPDGTLDQGFGVGGKVTTAALAGAAFSLAVGPAGTIVVAGFGDVVRYLPTGTQDASFGVGGRVTIPGTRLLAVTVLPDGRTLLAGSNSQGDFFVARLTSVGTLDGTFGVGGRVVTDLGGQDLATQLLLLPDDKLVAVGETVGLGSDFALVRYLPDGSLDPTFGSGGKVITDLGSTSDHGDDAVLTSEGKIVVTGASFPNLALARYLPDGTLDPTFGTGGVAKPTVGEAWGVAQQSDGKLVVTTGKLAAARLTAEGALDNTFGSGGIADAGLTGESRALALDGAGHVIVAGTSQADFKIVRYLGFVASDTTPPTLAVPDPIVADAATPLGAQVTFQVTATDNSDPNPGVSCSPTSHSIFPIGTTIVSCTATDVSGNSATATFTVHVKGAAEQLVDLAAAVQGVGPGKALADTVALAQALLAHDQLQATCVTLTVFTLEVRAQLGKKIPVAQAETLIATAQRIKAVLRC